MYYYGIDFHDLSPNSFLNILAFIVVCEAFLRIQPHFGLWLKVFNVKPKVVDGQHAECGLQWRHGGQDAQRYMARGLLCGNHKGVAIGVVLHHRAT